MDYAKFGKNYLQPHRILITKPSATLPPGITDNHEKQKFLKTVYENFYKVYNPKGADKTRCRLYAE
ncbi:MAG: hypothetical protein WKF71_19090 [Pyrinomonadaceae bacterium]